MVVARFCAPPRFLCGVIHSLFRLACGAALWAALCSCACAAGFSFAALGDTPYNAYEERRLIAMLGEINRELLAFVVHVGDFKDGHTECSDELYLQRRELFDASHHPLIFIPGDNEWTDCWRRSAGGYKPLERLQRLREVFFAEASSLGMRRLPLTRQSDADPAYPYAEHLRWVHERVMFVTLNVPGGDNNFTRDRAEFRVRDAAARAWLAQSFRLARSRGLQGVVLMMQANPWAAVGPRRHAFTPLLEAMTAETLKFQGEVLLIHGDTHRYRVNRPLLHPRTRRPLANFTRLEVFGSPSVNWVRVHVREENGRVRFDAEPGESP